MQDVWGLGACGGGTTVVCGCSEGCGRGDKGWGMQQRVAVCSPRCR